MELNKVEVQQVEQIAAEAVLSQLNELELALVGGGIGETIL